MFTGDAVVVSPGGTARGPAEIAERTLAETRDPHLVTDTVLRRLDRAVFLDAITGDTDAANAAESVVSRRLLAG